MLTKIPTQEPSYPQKLGVLEDHMLNLPQVECPVIHHFGPGIYIREVHLSAGTLAIGHAQRFEHLNVMMQGAVAIVGDSGHVKVLRAPLIFTGGPGRKFGYVLEDTIWQNIYATDETDIDTLENTYLDKSEAWSSHSNDLRKMRTALHEEDRIDFNIMLGQYGFTPEVVRKQSENTEDQTPMPPGCSKVTVRDSYIEGKGIFLSSPTEADDIIGPARIDGLRTPLGRYTNHAKNPNAKFELSHNGDIYLRAVTRISGCVAGELGDEVTVDYRQALSLSNIKLGEQL